MGFLANDNVNEETKIVKRICLSLSGLQKHQFWEDCYFERKRLSLSRRKITRIVAFQRGRHLLQHRSESVERIHTFPFLFGTLDHLISLRRKNDLLYSLLKENTCAANKKLLHVNATTLYTYNARDIVFQKTIYNCPSSWRWRTTYAKHFLTNYHWNVIREIIREKV